MLTTPLELLVAGRVCYTQAVNDLRAIFGADFTWDFVHIKERKKIYYAEIYMGEVQYEPSEGRVQFIPSTMFTAMKERHHE